MGLVSRVGGPEGGWGHKQTRASKMVGEAVGPVGPRGVDLGLRTGDRVSGCEVAIFLSFQKYLSRALYYAIVLQ